MGNLVLTNTKCIRKCTLMLLTFFTVSCSCFSQFGIKVKSGVAISHLKRPTSFNYVPGSQVSKVGFQIGGVLEFPLKKSLSLQTELLYTVRGLRDTTYIYSLTTTGNGYPYYRGYGYNFHYLELPVIFRVSSSKGFNLGIGPSVAYLLHADKVLDGKKLPKNKINLSKMDYALNGDVSYSYKLFEIGVRYTYSLGDVQYLGNTDPEFFQSGRVIGKNRSFQLYLGFRIQR